MPSSTGATLYRFFARGWLAVPDSPALNVKTLVLSTAGARVRHENAPPNPGTSTCLRLALLVGETPQFVDVPVTVRDTVLSQNAYQTDLDFPPLDSTLRNTLELVLRGRPAVSSR